MRNKVIDIIAKFNQKCTFKYVMLLILVCFLLGTGTTYAYYFVSDSLSSLTGNMGKVDLTLTVTKVLPKTNGVDNVLIINHSELASSLNNDCLDSDGEFTLCQVYKVNLKNANRVLNTNVKGSISFNNQNAPNLSWIYLGNSFSTSTNYTNSSLGNSFHKSSPKFTNFVDNYLLEAGSNIDFYILVWINETDDIQYDDGIYSGTIRFEDTNGNGVTAKFGDTSISVSPNSPNLDDGNLIPVYFDEKAGTTGQWKKADSSNANNSWYNYENKMWANAVLINSSATTNYKTAAINTTVKDSDIVAFYVWIPRFKYRLWNITRQGGAESTYAYPAYSKGIDIIFENGTDSTGNVECTYDVTTPESETNLSDVCIYNGTDTITVNSSNTNYTNAWYTHPAFTFGNDEIEGFWIGKFETSGSASAPRILPDMQSLREQTISVQFTTSKKFQNYLTSNMDAHMLTNLEWGAVAYLTHSIYGLCDGISCDGVYINNSSGYYTGRSGGAIAESTNLNLANVYPKSSTSTTKHNSTGYYDYKGYFIDYSGTVTTTKDITKVASTTRNITGVYDMSGGSHEYVMGNMVDSSYNFYPSSSGATWNGSTSLDFKYYNSYSYGTNYYKTIAFNRARLGDATSEVLGSATSSGGAWKVGSETTGSNSNFPDSPDSWFSRGGSCSSNYSGSFYFGSYAGNSHGNYSFRSSLL